MSFWVSVISGRHFKETNKSPFCLYSIIFCTHAFIYATVHFKY